MKNGKATVRAVRYALAGVPVHVCLSVPYPTIPYIGCVMMKREKQRRARKNNTSTSASRLVYTENVCVFARMLKYHCTSRAEHSLYLFIV